MLLPQRLAALLAVLVRYLVVPAVLPSRRRAEPGPVRLRLALEHLGGAWIKLGQALALRFDILPPDYCHELFKLLNEVKPFPYADVERIFEEDFGVGPEDLFQSLEREPFAAASIGQVHRAVLRSGATVAVKVQRPGIRRQISTDVRLMYLGAGLLDLLHVLGSTKSRDVVDEFSRWTADELDYRVEARQAVNLAEYAVEDDLEYDPHVYFELSSSRVLTLEFIDGIPVIDILYALRADNREFLNRLKDQGYDLGTIASNITWNLLNQVYRYGYFHADLHPANLFVLPDNAIGYVDFGIIGTLSADVRESLLHYAWNLFRGELDEAVNEWTRWVQTSSQTDLTAALQDIRGLLESFLFQLRGGRRLREQQGDTAFEVAMLGVIRRNRMRVSPSVVAYLKALVTANAVIFELDPDFDLQAEENRFFGRMVLADARSMFDPREAGAMLFEYRHRVNRVLDDIDAIGRDTRSFEDLSSYVRRGIVWFGAGAVVMLALLLYAVSSGRSTGVLVGLGVVLAGFVLAMLSRVRALPAAGRGVGSPGRSRRSRRARVRRIREAGSNGSRAPTGPYPRR